MNMRMKGEKKKAKKTSFGVVGGMGVGVVQGGDIYFFGWLRERRQPRH